MFFVEPPPSPYDLHFNVGDVPVRVHWTFWLMTLLLGAGADGDPARVLLWTVAEFACILVHELGHVAAFRYYGMNAHVVLHSFGGLAIPTSGRWGGRGRSRETWLADVVISLAGPVAGFAFAAVIFLGLALGGRAPHLHFDLVSSVPIFVEWEPFNANNVNRLLQYMQFINIFWGLVNLLPIIPLDGGQVARAVAAKVYPADGLRLSLILSVVAAVGMAAFCFLRWEEVFAAIFFAYMAYQSYQMLQQVSGGGFGGRGW
ncbi:MAG TPA: site-2 protease family protein [Pirellulales bacterium]|jgi:Zn-dependent protease